MDIGMTLGMMLRNRNLENLWKIQILGPTCICYWIGAVMGTLTFSHWGENALYVNATVALSIGVITFILLRTPCCSFENAFEQEEIQKKKEEEMKQRNDSEKHKLNHTSHNHYQSI